VGYMDFGFWILDFGFWIARQGEYREWYFTGRQIQNPKSKI